MSAYSPSPQRMIDFVRRAMRYRFGDARACFFFGSAMRGEMGFGSDVDVMLISNDDTTAFQEHYSLAGYDFDIRVMSKRIFLNALTGQRTQNVDYFERAITDSVIVWDDDGTGLELRDQVRKGDDERWPFWDWMPRRLIATSLLRDVQYGVSHAERVGAATDLYTELNRIYLLMRGNALGSSKHMAKLLFLADTPLFESLHAAFRAALGGDFAEICQLGEEALRSIGGAFSPGERMYLLTEARRAATRLNSLADDEHDGLVEADRLGLVSAT